MQKIIMSVLIALMSVFPVLRPVTAPADSEDFVPVLRFMVASDSHIGAIASERSLRVQRAIQLAYSDAESDSRYKALDAVLFAGDLTDNGNRFQYYAFYSAVQAVLKGDTQMLGVVAKSHDGSALGKKSLAYYEEMTGQSSDFHTVIRGYHFIGLSASKIEGEWYSEYQHTWLKAELEKAAADDPTKPIFVMHHEHVKGTVYGSSEFEGWGLDDFTDILSAYPQVVDFSGHSHYPLNDPRSVWQGAFTAVGTGSLKYAEFTVDDVRTVHPDGYKKDGQAWIVEVSADNAVRLRGMDVLSGEWLCAYTLRDVANAQNRQYTPEQQKASSSAPCFPKDAKPTVKKTGKSFAVSCSAAESTDGNIVFLYRFTVLDENGQTVSNSWTLNNYWHSQTFATVTQTIEASAGMTVRITAENAYGMQSEPLEVVL